MSATHLLFVDGLVFGDDLELSTRIYGAKSESLISLQRALPAESLNDEQTNYLNKAVLRALGLGVETKTVIVEKEVQVKDEGMTERDIVGWSLVGVGGGFLVAGGAWAGAEASVLESPTSAGSAKQSAAINAWIGIGGAGLGAIAIGTGLGLLFTE